MPQGVPIVAQLMQVEVTAMRLVQAVGMGMQREEGRWCWPEQRGLPLGAGVLPRRGMVLATTAANLRFAQSVYMEGVAGEAARSEANRI